MMRAGSEDTGPSGSGGLRISDSDRDQVADVLGEHAAEGRLTMDELDQRLGVLYAARTRAQAAAVVADLPALAAPQAPHHLRLGREHEHDSPGLPEWLTSNRQVDSAPPESGAVPAAADGSTATPAPIREDRAALRKRAKLRQDENAIGHTFQATRRAINAELERASASGQSDEVQRLKRRLGEAQQTADTARQAVAAGNRAEAQRLLARLRNLVPDR
jgi:hypothetical protein